MASLKTKIQADLKESLQEKNALRCSVLRMLNSAIVNKEKEKRAKLSKTEALRQAQGEKLEELSQLTDEEIIEVISSEAKKHKDSIEQFENAGRLDLSEQEKKELEILKEYLPEQMNEAEVRKLVKEKITELGASSSKDIGKIMAGLMPQLKGKVDGGLVNKIIQEELKKKQE